MVLSDFRVFVSQSMTYLVSARAEQPVTLIQEHKAGDHGEVSLQGTHKVTLGQVPHMDFVVVCRTKQASHLRFRVELHGTEHPLSTTQVMCAVLTDNIPDLHGGIAATTRYQSATRIKHKAGDWACVERLPCPGQGASLQVPLPEQPIAAAHGQASLIWAHRKCCHLLLFSQVKAFVHFAVFNVKNLDAGAVLTVKMVALSWPLYVSAGVKGIVFRLNFEQFLQICFRSHSGAELNISPDNHAVKIPF
uniref:Putative transducin beta-like protein 3 n=1 Tax=Ixodes ricinus TaxID=34613 RepID=A0A0K8RFP0_IXORI